MSNETSKNLIEEISLTKASTILLEFELKSQRIYTPLVYVIELGEGREVVHMIKTKKDDHWIPSPRDIRFMISFFKLFEQLTKIKKQPTKEELDKVVKLFRQEKIRLTDVLRVLYGDQIVKILEKEE